MTNRSASIVFLYLAALVTTAVALALALALAPRVAASPGPWLMPVTTFVCFVAIFFLARDIVLPAAFAAPAWKAALALSLWMAVTLIAWRALMWAAAPIMTAVGLNRGRSAMLLVCLLVSVKLLERAGSRRDARFVR